MGHVDPKIESKIQFDNHWYVGSHFEWAERPSIKPIYDGRTKYFLDCIGRAQNRLGQNLSLLDAGCGDGYWLARLQSVPGLTLTGVDYNPLRVERARQVARHANVLQGDLRDITFSGDLFDMVLLSQVIEHVEDDVGLLQMVKSVIRPGGMLILGTPNEGSLLHQCNLQRTGGLRTTDHVHFYTEQEICNKIAQTGFVIESVLREVFYPGHDRLYYSLLARPWGFRLLERMTTIWPNECSDYYFECHLSDEVDFT